MIISLNLEPKMARKLQQILIKVNASLTYH